VKKRRNDLCHEKGSWHTYTWLWPTRGTLPLAGQGVKVGIFDTGLAPSAAFAHVADVIDWTDEGDPRDGVRSHSQTPQPRCQRAVATYMCDALQRWAMAHSSRES
jgi:hypothetical protein